MQPFFADKNQAFWRLQAVGWALVYLPHLPQGFSYSGVDPANHPNLAEAIYVSLTTLSTVGFGDVVATSPWIRVAAPLQALLTAVSGIERGIQFLANTNMVLAVVMALIVFVVGPTLFILNLIPSQSHCVVSTHLPILPSTS